MSEIKKDYTLITNELEFYKAVKHIEVSDYLTFDVESTGLNVRKDKVIGFGFCGEVGTAFYVPMFRYIVKEDKLEYIGKYVEEIMNLLKEKDLIMHNGSYDIRIVKNDMNIDLVNNLVADTILLWHSINEEGPFGLKTICSELQDKIGYDVYTVANEEQEVMKKSIEENGGTTTKTKYELYKADWDKIGYYCCADVDMTLRLFEHCYSEIEKDEDLIKFVLDEEVMPLYRDVTIPMEDTGVLLDKEYIETNYAALKEKLEYYKAKTLLGIEKEKAFENWLKDKLEKDYKTSPKGNFGNQLASHLDLDLPISEKSGKYSLSKSNLERLKCDDMVKSFLLGTGDLPEDLIFTIKKKIWVADNDGRILNLNSKKQLADIVFNYMNIKPLSKTKKGAPQFNDTTIDHLSEEGLAEWASDLKAYNKLSKIKTTYYDRFLSKQEDWHIYFNYKQHGTISGRYGSDAQQLPRPMEEGEDCEDVVYFNNTVRRFFIAEEGRVFIDADYESLEPHVFAHVSGDEGLRDIFRKGHDFYSTIAIKTEGLLDVSADKKADNYLGKVNKALRQSAKAYSLGVPYGMSPYALSKSLEIEEPEAKRLIEGYLGGFPDLKKWMNRSKRQAQYDGMVKSEVGRIRHLDKVKDIYKKHGDKLLDYRYRNKLKKQLRKNMSEEEVEKEVMSIYLDYKNGINNSRNFQIQSLAGSIVNRAAIAVQRAFKERGIDAWVCAQVHDQLIFNVPESCKEECKELIQSIMENNYKLSLDLKAPPEEAKNWRDGH